MIDGEHLKEQYFYRVMGNLKGPPQSVLAKFPTLNDGAPPNPSLNLHIIITKVSHFERSVKLHPGE